MPQSVLQSPVVYSKQFTTGTAGTGTPAFTANTTAGSCLLLALSLFTTALGPTITSVTTNGSTENWIFLYQDPDGYVLWYINPATAGGQTTIDINVSFGGTASTSNSMVLLAKLWEDGGLGPAVIADVSQSANNIGTSFASNSGTADTTTQADEIWHAAMGLAVNAANTTSTASQTSGGGTDSALGGSSYQSGGTGTADKFNVYLLGGYQVATAIGSPSYPGTTSASGGNGASVVTLAPLPQAAAAAPPGVILRAAPQAAQRGKLTSSRAQTGQGPVRSPFPPPRAPLRPISPAAAPRGVILRAAPQAAQRGKLTSSRGQTGQGPVPSPFPPPRAPLRPAPQAAQRGRLTSSRAPAPPAGPSVPAPFYPPHTLARGARAAQRGKLTSLAAPAPVIHPSVPAPFYPPHVLLRGKPPYSRSTSRGQAAPPPAPPSQAGNSIVQGRPHVISPSAATLNQGSIHVISPYADVLIQEWDQ